MTLSQATERLRAAGIDSAEHDARELFRAFSGATVPYARKDLDCGRPELIEAVERRAAREPLQYIIGRVGFYREEYEVCPSVLIPRSDTEHLVDYAVASIPEGENFIDLCTGSGCVAISTLKNTRGTSAVAVDISSEALAVARRNAELNGVCDRITLLECDVLRALPEGRFFAVLSNPPYVTDDAYRGLEPEIYAEPRRAFVGGRDGGDFYRAIIPSALKILKPGGFIALEIGYDQRELITALADEQGMSAEIIKDYSGNDRVAVLRPRNSA